MLALLEFADQKLDDRELVGEATDLCASQFPVDMVELGCDKCGRRGRLHKPKLIQAYEPDVALLPGLRTMIARSDRAHNMSDPCAAHNMALKPI